MTTDQMDSRANFYARTDNADFPQAEKLAYYAEADGILNALIIAQQEDKAESVPTAVSTVAGQSAYAVPSRNHHVNWVMVDYGGGFVPARWVDEATLISWFGSEYLTAIAAWSPTYPLWYRKAGSINLVPAPTSAQAGAGRLKYSLENLPADLDRASNNTPTLVPPNFHYLEPAYAATKWLDRDDPLWAKATDDWVSGTKLMLETMYPDSREREIIAGLPDDPPDYPLDFAFGSGSGGSAGNYADAETPSGAIDGVNATFTLLHSPNPAASMFLVQNGMYLTQGVDYNLSGNTITFVTPPDALFSGLPFLAYYRY